MGELGGSKRKRKEMRKGGMEKKKNKKGARILPRMRRKGK